MQLSAHFEQTPEETKYPSAHLMHLELELHARQLAGKLEQVKHFPFCRYCPVEQTKHLLVALQAVSILQLDLSEERR